MNNFFAATFAPLTKGNKLNVKNVSTYASFLQRNGLSGAFINGSTGNFTALSVKERMELTEAWSDQKSNDFKIINHVGHTDINLAKQLALHSADKTDGIAVLAPYYFTCSTLDDLLYYCSEIAKQAPHIPFYYYHIPVLSHTDFNMLEFQQKAIQNIPNFKGIKFTKNDLITFGQCSASANSSFDLLFGVDELFLASLSYNTAGWVGSTYNLIAPLYMKIKETFDKHNFKEALVLQNLAIQFVSILQQNGGYHSLSQALMQHLGIDCGINRFPHRPCSEATIKLTLQHLDLAGITPYLNS